MTLLKNSYSWFITNWLPTVITMGLGAVARPGAPSLYTTIVKEAYDARNTTQYKAIAFNEALMELTLEQRQSLLEQGLISESDLTTPSFNSPIGEIIDDCLSHWDSPEYLNQRLDDALMELTSEQQEIIKELLGSNEDSPDNPDSPDSPDDSKGPRDPFNPPSDPFGGAGDARWDPLVLDLDGDGIETTNISSGAYFDFDNNGFAEKSGWVKSDDGVLVMDRNGDGIINDGQELFGDRTILSNGQRATDGFQALADLDINGDGKIDVNDTDYSKIRVWRDMNSDGYSSADELFTLEELGIKSLNLSSSITNTTDSNGNTQISLGSFEKQDGTVQSIGQYLFDNDPIHSIATDLVDIPQEIRTLPYLQGHGNVYDLWQAIARDESGTLQALLETFMAESDPEQRDAIMNQLLYTWTNSNTLDPASRGGNMDARQLSVLEKMFGQQFTGLITTQGTTSNPNINAAAILKDIYIDVKEYYYVRLMAQTHMSALLDDIDFTWDAASNKFIDNLTDVQVQLDTYFSQSYDEGVKHLTELSRVLYGLGLTASLTSFAAFRDYFAATYGMELGALIDSAGKNLHGIVSGGDGDDALYGGLGSNTFYGGKGNDIINGGAGEDNLFGQEGNDILDGGSGNDYLEGGAGNDTYRYGIGSGNDRICNYGSSEEFDIVQFADGITLDMLEYRQNGNDLIITIKATGETLTLTNMFRGEVYQVDKLVCVDGTEWTAAQLSEMVTVQGTASNDTLYGADGHDDKMYALGGNDTLYGYQGNDIMDGGDGDDFLYGNDGNDVLIGGAGNDYLEGGVGDDVYLWGTGAGNDTIHNAVQTMIWKEYLESGNDTVQLGAGITADAVEWQQNGEDIILTIKASGETLTFSNWFASSYVPVKTIRFDDGTALTAEQVNDLTTIKGTNGADVLKGSDNLNDIIFGGAGDDQLYGQGGNDILDGGAGNDYLEGGVGDDVYLWGTGAGNDTIHNAVQTMIWKEYLESGNDTVQLGAGLTTDAVEWQQNGEDVILKIKASGETLTFSNWFASSYVPVKIIRFADGTVLTAEQVNDLMTIKGTNGADVLRGSDNLNDIIFGGAGDDQLYGQGGNDILDGGAGNDYLEGGAGNDRYLWDTGAGNDTIHNAVQTIIWKEYLESGNDTVQLGAGLTTDAVEWQQNGEDVILKIKASGETLTFTNWFVNSYVPVKSVRFADGTILTAEQVSPLAVIKNTDGNDTLKGSDFRDDRIFGGAGNDTLNGGAGADTMIGGTGNDTYVVDNAGDIVIENAEEGIDTVQASITYTLGSHLENLTLTGTAAINGTGNDLDNVLTGNNGSNLLQSGVGNDTLNGGSGADTMIGGTGNDTYVVDNAGDIVIENAGEGIDTVQASVTYTLGSHQENLTLTLWSVINGTGNDLDNILTGNIVNNILNGGAGNDILDGGAGADTMIGGTGNDIYVVDSSGDIVIENAGEGIDTVETNLTYTLGSHLENLTLTGTGAINGTGNDLDNILTGNKRNNSLNGGAGNDILNGDAGNDVLDGGAGSDTLYGGLGDDTYLWGSGSGDDTIIAYAGDAGHGYDTLQFQNLVQAALEFTISGSDLICTLTQTGETVQLTNWILGTNYQVDQFRFTDGTLTATQINQRVA